MRKNRKSKSSSEWILTTLGRQYFYGGKNKYSLADIVGPLSKTCRFGGHVKKFYSVAQHSVLCAQNVDDEFRFEALMHDAHEAFVLDVPTPMKRKLPDYRRLEAAAKRELSQKFGVPFLNTPAVKIVDKRMLATEMRDLMAEYPVNPLHGIEQREPFEFHVEPLLPDDAYDQFIEMFVSIAR